VSLAGFANADDSPWADHQITCKEMEMSPKAVFDKANIDLGSGHGSPNVVDYGCAKSLGQLDFLQQIISNANMIRSPSSLSRYCTGTIVYAQWRYYHFELAKLGYYPQGFHPRSGKTRGREYFEEWSYQSIYNRKIYEGYLAEIAITRPLLVDWYIKNHSIDLETARQYADNALTTISNYGFGSYYYYWKPEELVPFTREAIDGNYDNFSMSLGRSSDTQKLNSLRRLLLHQPPEGIIEEIANSISGKNSKKRSESPISNAVYSPNILRLLLEVGFDPNHQNYFGKTPLYYAIQYNQHESARALLDYGANVNHTYQLEKEGAWDCSGIKRWGRTPLMHAAQHSDVEMIRLLLKSGANIHDKDVLGSTALEYAENNGRKENNGFLTVELKK
jgi:hypothetical protein